MGSLNEADALSRRPDLMESSRDALDSLLKTQAPLNQNSKLAKGTHAFADEDFEKDIEDYLSLNSITHLLPNVDILNRIRKGYDSDPMYLAQTLPAGYSYDNETQLYTFANKLCVPNDPVLRKDIFHECHNTQGHPGA